MGFVMEIISPVHSSSEHYPIKHFTKTIIRRWTMGLLNTAVPNLVSLTRLVFRIDLEVKTFLYVLSVIQYVLSNNE